MRTLGHHEGDLPCSYQAYRQSLTLPLYPAMTDSDIERVAAALRKAIVNPA